MTRLVLPLALLLPLLAQAGGPELRALEHRWSLLENHRSRLEQRLNAQVVRIGRLKQQPNGVRRDYQLKSALRENQSLASKLTALQHQLRGLGEQLTKAYRQALAATNAPKERRRLSRRLHELQSQQRTRLRVGSVGRASPLDSAEDLEEKADLLRDSEEKVRRQLRLIQRQITRLKRRERLRRHSRSAEDSPFVEDSPRRMARSRTSTPQRSDDGATTAAPAAEPSNSLEGAKEAPSADADAAPGAMYGGGAVPAAPKSPAAPTLSLTLRGAMDPGLLRELQRAEKRGDVKARIAALNKARARLEAMARKLGQQAKTLQKKAKSTR